MKIAILTSLVYHQCKEVHGYDRVVWGGAERYLIELCNTLKEDGHEVELYQQINPAGLPNETVAAIRGKNIVKSFRGFKITLLGVLDYANTYGAMPNLNATFNEYSAQHDLRIYYVTNLCYPHVKLPAISISHGVYWDHPTALHRTTYTQDQQGMWLNRTLYGFTAPNLCVSVDSNVKNVVRAIRPGIENRIMTIPNFVDVDKFPQLDIKDDNKTVLFPRRFVSVRGSNDFLQASLKYPQYDYLAVGQPNDRNKEQAMDAYKSIQWVATEPEGMADNYAKACMAVVPTQCSEGLSLSLLESLASGLPVISTLNGGLGTAIIPNFNALVYDPDFDNLGDLIHLMMEDKHLRDMLAKNARRSVYGFDIKIWKEKWKFVINNI